MYLNSSVDVQRQAIGSPDGRAYQHTLKGAISCTGVGLHSGSSIRMTLLPAAVDTGVIFRRLDPVSGDEHVAARWDGVSDTVLSTTIANDSGVKVATIEHLMAALVGCGVDNVIVEIDGAEVPVMDGSSAPFVFLIECAGLVAQDARRRYLRILKTVEARDGDRLTALEPSDGFSIGFQIDFDSPVVGSSEALFDLHNGGFKRDICRARTFGFESDIRKLWDLGLARGGSLDNAVVVSADHRILNEGGLRYEDEFVRHKILDSYGDLFLAGAPIIGHFIGVCSGHTLNNRVLHALFDDPEAWEWTTDQPVALSGFASGPIAATA